MYRSLLKSAIGATLIELVTTIVVISIAAVILIKVTSVSTGRSVDPMIQQQAVAIAQAYLEEIMQKGFCDPDYDVDSNPATPLNCPVQCTGRVCQPAGCRNSGSAQEGSRPLYDDICDYNGLSDSGAVDQTGSAVPGLSQYDVNVQVIDDGTVNLNGLTGTAGQAARITVTVTNPALQDPIKVTGFRANY